MQAENGGPVKIGYSLDPWKRANSLQTSSPEEFVLRSVIPGSRHTEAHFHEVFRKFHIRGEWFEPHPMLAKLAAVKVDDTEPESQGEVAFERSDEPWPPRL